MIECLRSLELDIQLNKIRCVRPFSLCRRGFDNASKGHLFGRLCTALTEQPCKGEKWSTVDKAFACVSFLSICKCQLLECLLRQVQICMAKLMGSILCKALQGLSAISRIFKDAGSATASTALHPEMLFKYY